MANLEVSSFIDTFMQAADRAAAASTLFTAGTLTSDQKVIDASATWNNAGVTFTALKLNVTDSASAAASLLADLQVSGVSYFSVKKNADTAWRMNSSGTSLVDLISGNTPVVKVTQSTGLISALSPISLTFFTGAGSTNPAILTADAADILAQRNGANAQTFRLYNTYTSASNYERAELAWSGNLAYLQTAANGSGTSRDLFIRSGGQNVFLGTGGGGAQWKISSGHFLANTNNAYDIGASAGGRPRNGYFGTDVYCRNTIQSPQSSVTLAANGQLAFEATDNSTITVKFRGSDGTTRTATIALT